MTEPYYQDDSCIIYHADCRDVLPELPKVDLVLTDPPFSRDVYLRASAPNTKTGSGTKDRMGLNSFGCLRKLSVGDIGYIDDMLEDVSQAISNLSQGWIIVFSDVESCHKWRNAFMGSGMRYVRTGAWVKTNPMPQMSGDRPAVGFEPCIICHAPGKMRWNGGGHSAVWQHKISQGASRPDHPCPKPLSLMSELVGLFSDLNNLIIDPFMGSGTTLRAAKDLGRKAIGIEIEEKYCEIAAKRLAQEVLPL